MVVRAPAKVNLYLDVVGKRKDGYHEISTLFLKIRLADKLYFKKIKKGIKLSCTGIPVPTDSSNLVYKAALLMQQAGKTGQGVHIRMVKNIPVGAGLGGGSSDAAATLRGLNRLWKLWLPEKTIFRLGARLGADVPFFLLKETAAWGRGRGDRLTPVKLLKKFWFVLIKPAFAISTKEIYSGITGNLTKKKNDVKLLVHALNNYDVTVVGKLLYNRLETVAFKRYSSLTRFKKMLSALGVRAVLMSGSGSVIFGLLDAQEKALCVQRQLCDRHESMVVRSL
jgi:4-diphosphocytidyl-2-C-methyl-D-erythritol kinase